jgi:asparagine synthetase B (glutamine-hydrolysing)
MIISPQIPVILIRDTISDTVLRLRTQADQNITGCIDWLSPPLYLRKKGSKIHASHTLSELYDKATFTPNDLSKSAIRDFIANGPSIYNQSIYCDVVTAPPGSKLKISPDGTIRIERQLISEEQLVQQFEPTNIEALLCDEIQKSLKKLKSKRICFALSGGVDSTLLVALCKHHKIDNDITCYTADTGIGNDLTHARAAAQALDTGLTTVKIDYSSNALTEQARLSKASGCPIPFIGNSIGFSLICKAARDDGFDAIIDGTGSDQIFAGTYGIHGLHWYTSAISMLPAIHSAEFREHTTTHSLLSKKAKNRLNRKPPESFSLYLYDEITQGSLQNWRVQHRASSLANDIQVITPFLRQNIARNIWSPLDNFYQKGINKFMLRNILAKYVPNEIAWRVDNQGLRWSTSKLYSNNRNEIAGTIRNNYKSLSTMLNTLQRLAYSSGVASKSKIMRIYSICSLLSNPAEVSRT